jgi:hypothetical protein
MTIDSKEVNTTRRRVEDAMTENRKECILIRRGLTSSGRIGERGAKNCEEDRGMEKENPKARWKIQRGRDWWNGSKKMNGKC